MTELSVAPRRFGSPNEIFARAKVEPIHQPIYSSMSIDNAAAIPRETTFFQYSIGGTVAGAGLGAVTPATELHTNMETAGFLASPKLFKIEGIRIHLPAVGAALAAVLQASSVADNAVTITEDLEEVTYGTVYRLFVGTKDYVRGPCWMFPSNTGIGGIADAAQDDAAAAAPGHQSVIAHHTEGKYFGLPTYPVLIFPQQNFFSSLGGTQATPPTVATALDIIVYNVLDGVFGREVQ